MATPINTILSWFETGDFPTQEQFEASWTSFYHKDESIPMDKVENLNDKLLEKVDKSVYNAHLTNENAHITTLAKLDASNLNDVNIQAWKTILGIGSLPPNVALIDDIPNALQGNVYTKIQSNALYMALETYVNGNGKILADMIEALGLTELIEAVETTIAAFAANSGNYTFQDNDFIAIPNNGSYSLYMYKGGSKTITANYLPTGLTNITIAMVQGLQAALDAKLDKPTGAGNFFVNRTGTVSSYQIINPAANYLVFWNTTNFVESGIYHNTGKYGIGTTSPSEMLHLNNGRLRTKAVVLDDNSEQLPGQITYFNRRFKGTDITGTSRDFMYADFTDYKALWQNFTDAQKNEIKTIANGGWTTGTMSVALISPTVVDSADKPTWITLRGANLNFNPASFSVQIIDNNGNILDTVPNSQVQLYADGLTLTFWYNFKNIPLGTFKIRLWNGVAIYNTTLSVNKVTTVDYINMSGWVWQKKVLNNVASTKLLAQSALISYSPDSAVMALGNAPTKIFKTKSPQLSDANENFYLEMTVSFSNFMFNPGPTYAFGISTSNEVNSLVDDFVISAQMYAIPNNNPMWIGLSAYYGNVNQMTPAKFIFYKLGNTLNKISIINFGSGNIMKVETVTIDPAVPLFFGANFSQGNDESRAISISIDTLYKF